jgi:hypothetical protein
MTKRIIFLNGPAGSGKDSIGDQLRKDLGENRAFITKFARPLKQAVRDFLSLSDAEYNFYFETQEGKATRSERFNNKTPREALITFSEKFAKEFGGKGIFGKKLAELLEEQKDACLDYWETLIITDSGFKEEAEVLIERMTKLYHPTIRFLLVNVNRNGCTFDGDSRGFISLYNVPSLVLHNNGTLEEASNEIIQELKDMESYGE